MTFAVVAFTACEFGIIGHEGEQHPVDGEGLQPGIEASNGIAPIANTTTLATTLVM